MSEMAVMNREGDTKVEWDRSNANEVEAARRSFDDLVGQKRYAAFKMGPGAKRGEQIRTFDPDAERIVLVPPMRGG